MAKDLISLIYNHWWVFNLMRTYSSGREILKPVTIRFAKAYLILRSLYKQNQALRGMFNLDEFVRSTWVKNHNGTKAKSHHNRVKV